MLNLKRLLFAGSVLLGWESDRTRAAEAVIRFADTLVRTRGLTNTVRYLKEMQRCVSKSVAGQPQTVAMDGLPIGLDSQGLPKAMPWKLRKAIRGGDVMAIRIALFLYELFRSIRLPDKEPDFTSISSPPTVDVDAGIHALQLASYLPKFVVELRKFGVKFATPGALRWKSLHSTNKVGPNGSALFTSHIDALKLAGSSLWETFLKVVALTGSDDLKGFMLRLIEVTRPLYAKQRITAGDDEGLGKLALKQEPAGKVRIFAIPDYWTQAILRPLHHYLFEVLRLLPTDCTFDQDAGVRSATEASKITKRFWSFDLSSATDRFPLAVTSLVLKALVQGLYGRGYVDSVLALLVDRPYMYTPRTPPGAEASSKEPYRYRTGQPMGAYGSWAMFAVSHHFIVQVAHWRSGGEGWYTCYQLLGDDVVLWGDGSHHERVANEYTRILAVLGVPINKSKGFESSNGAFEFAKRLVKRGQVLTVFHWKEWASALRTPAAYAAFVARLMRTYARIDFVAAAIAYIFALDLEWDSTRRVGSWPRRVRDMVVALTSPVGSHPLAVELWGRVLEFSILELSCFTDVGAVPGSNDASGVALVKYDPQWVRLRQLLWEGWEREATRAANAATRGINRWKEVIVYLLLDFVDPVHPKFGGECDQAALWRFWSVHPWLVIARRIVRQNFREGLSFAYAPLIASGMQSHGWWLAEDLPDDVHLGDLLTEQLDRSLRPIESYLRSPFPEVQGLAVPTRLGERSDERDIAIKTSASFLSRAHAELRGIKVPDSRLELIPTGAGKRM